MCVNVDETIVCSNLQEELDYYMEKFSKHVKEVLSKFSWNEINCAY